MSLKDENLYFIGGVVRDEMLGIPSLDTDYCYEGDAIEFAKQKGLNILRENPAFGTVRVLFEDKEIDIASTREEFYPQKGHLPLVSNIGCALLMQWRNELLTVKLLIFSAVKKTLRQKKLEFCIMKVLSMIRHGFCVR